MNSNPIKLLIVIIVLSFLSCKEEKSLSDPVRGNSVIINYSLQLFEKSPLTALALFETKVPCKIRLSIKGQDGEDFKKEFPEYSTKHEIPILGLYPDFKNEVTLFTESADHDTTKLIIPIQTKPLPKIFPNLELIKSDPNKISEGFYFLYLVRVDGGKNQADYPIAVDKFGKVRWFYYGEYNYILNRLKNNNLIIVENTVFWKVYERIRNDFKNFLMKISGNGSDTLNQKIKGPESLLAKKSFIDSLMTGVKNQFRKFLPLQRIVEIDLLGRRTGLTWPLPNGVHHDLIEIPNGNFLALTKGRNQEDDIVIEIERETGETIKSWDLKNILDIKRPPKPGFPTTDGVLDWLHLNALQYDEKKNSIIISSRNQSALVSIDKETGRIKWILGNHDKWSEQFRKYLFNPVENNFEWSWGQHAPVFSNENDNKILLFDNGNDRSYTSPLSLIKSYSRAVEYEIDEINHSIKQTWQYGKERGSESFSPFIGSAQYLADGNKLICFGGISRDLSGKPDLPWDLSKNIRHKTKNLSHVVEVRGNKNPKVVFELIIKDGNKESFIGYECYRAVKMSLYN